MSRIFLAFVMVLMMAGRVSAAPLVAAGYNRELVEDRGTEQVYRFHVRHINYKNAQGDFVPIDTRLQSDLMGGWQNDKASYHCRIPEYADDWFEFTNAYEGAAHTIKARPVAAHVKGTYTHDTDGSDFVLYPDAFGKGIDLKVYSYWAGLKKVIIINDKPVDTSKPLTFDFEMDLPKGTDGKEQVKDAVGTSWNKLAKLDFKDKTLKIGPDGNESYFRQARIWDSGEVNQSVDIELYTKDGKTFLRKTITPEILEKATFPVYTDHPTSYYAGAGDGEVYVTGAATWAACHSAVDGTGRNATGTSASILSRSISSSDFRIYRAFFPIDTSGIDDGATVTDALLYVYCGYKANTDNDGDDWINVVQTSQANPATLAVADYDQCGDVTDPTEGATRIDFGSLSTGTYNAFTLDATGISWIKKTAGDPYTMLGLREGHDASNNDIATGTVNQFSVSTSEDTSGTKDPYLDVTVGGAPPAANILPIDITRGFCRGMMRGVR